jgi:hypothetical protein
MRDQAQEFCVAFNVLEDPRLPKVYHATHISSQRRESETWPSKGSRPSLAVRSRQFQKLSTIQRNRACIIVCAAPDSLSLIGYSRPKVFAPVSLRLLRSLAFSRRQMSKRKSCIYTPTCVCVCVVRDLVDGGKLTSLGRS